MKFNYAYLYYILDWILCCLFIGIAKIFDVLYAPNDKVYFSIKDASISFPHAEKETVSNVWLWVISCLFPAIIIVGLCAIRKDWLQAHLACLALFLSLSSNYLITHVVKNLVGRLRPDFLHRCLPNLNDNGESIIKSIYGLNTLDICTQTNIKLLRDGRQSFFSGHSSTAFSGLFFLSLYLMYCVNLNATTYNKVVKVYITLFPIMVATFIMISRVVDYRHHFTDVLFGMIIGILCSLFSFYNYFMCVSKQDEIDKLNITPSNELMLLNNE